MVKFYGTDGKEMKQLPQGFEHERDLLLIQYAIEVDPTVEIFLVSKDGLHFKGKSYTQLQNALKPEREKLEDAIRLLKEKYGIKH